MGKDKGLILLLKSNNEEAIQTVYKKYSVLVRYIIKNIVKEENACDELMNDAFLKFYSNVYRLDEDRDISPYLTTIAKNLAYNYVSRKNNNIVYSDKIVDDKSTIESEENDNKALDIIESYLDGIELQVVTLKIINGYTYEEIKEALNISTSEAYRKYQSGIKKIKERVNG